MTGLQKLYNNIQASIEESIEESEGYQRALEYALMIVECELRKEAVDGKHT